MDNVLYVDRFTNKKRPEPIIVLLNPSEVSYYFTFKMNFTNSMRTTLVFLISLALSKEWVQNLKGTKLQSEQEIYDTLAEENGPQFLVVLFFQQLCNSCEESSQIWNSVVGAREGQSQLAFGVIDTVINKQLKKKFDLATLPEFVIFSKSSHQRLQKPDDLCPCCINSWIDDFIKAEEGEDYYEYMEVERHQSQFENEVHNWDFGFSPTDNLAHLRGYVQKNIGLAQALAGSLIASEKCASKVQSLDNMVPGFIAQLHSLKTVKLKSISVGGRGSTGGAAWFLLGTVFGAFTGFVFVSSMVNSGKLIKSKTKKPTKGIEMSKSK